MVGVYTLVSFEERNEELFAMKWIVNIPVWFAVDTRLGSLFIHLDTPQLFSAEMYSADLNIIGKPEDDKWAKLVFLKYKEVINYVVENMLQHPAVGGVHFS
ncbi:hypothetical protein CsSME_00045287 [Camellia sinensis var. sinensis]